jgi:hypothetical protein
MMAQDNMDIAPSVSVQADTAPSANFTYPKLFGWHYSAIAPVNAGTVGAMYLNDQFYVNAWNSANLFLYDGGLAGPQNLLNTLTYQGSIRDLTTDGTSLYGSPATTTIHEMDANGISQGTITSAGGNARAIAYSSDEDAFFVCDFNNNIGVINAQTGALIRTLTGTNALGAKYGMAYSTSAQVPGGPYLWVWGQGSLADPFNKLWKVDPQTGAVIDTYQFGPLPPSGTSVSGIAGGAEIVQIADRWVLLLNYQNFEIQGYDLGAVVPVELTSFTASVSDGKVNLTWSTASEINNHGFEVERKYSNGQFATVGFVEGYGTTAEEQHYTFVDQNLTPGTYSYRLKQIDFDGSFEYFNEIEVDVTSPVEFDLSQNYPNPFNPATTINFSLASDSKVTLKIFDVLGQEITTLVNGNMSAGIHNLNFNASSLNSGIYFYTIEAAGVDGTNFTSTKKMMLTK